MMRRWIFGLAVMAVGCTPVIESDGEDIEDIGDIEPEWERDTTGDCPDSGF